MAAEQAGYPSVVNVCEMFEAQGHGIGELGGMAWLPLAVYPGHIDGYDLETRNRYISEEVAPGSEEALTTQISGAAAAVADSLETDVFFTGTFDEVIDEYLDKSWTEGLPIVPPTKQKVEEFLKYTDYPADEILTRPLEPSYRQATPWSVAVNGVMAGCRPEYMPVLIAMTKCMAEPDFRIQDTSSTPGWEPMTIMNGPLANQLGFNYEQGVMGPGYQANTSVGRYWILFQRNILEIRNQLTEKGTFGQNYYTIIPENEDEIAAMGWNPLSVVRGFEPGENVITMVSCIHFMHHLTETLPETTEPWSKNHIRWIGYMLAKVNHAYRTPADITPVVLMSPLVAHIMADDGLSREDTRDAIWDAARIPAQEWEDFLHYFQVDETWRLCDYVDEGRLPELYCESDDPDRMIPMIKDPELIQLVVSGDPGRNRTIVTRQNGNQGPATSMKIELPSNWDALMAELGK